MKTRSLFLQSRTNENTGPLIFTNAAFAPNNVWFVQSTHSNAGDTDGRGQTPDQPFATIDYAVGKCEANKGDLIIVLPGHVETVAAAGGLDLDVAGITILGIGSGSLQPKIDLTAATADVDIDAANITLENFQFEASAADVVAAVDVNAANFTLRRCRFLEPTADENFLICILGATSTTSNGITVEDCEFYSVDAANTHGISLPGTSDRCIIRRNLFQGVFETGAIGAAGAVTSITVAGNLVRNTSSDADECIVLAANSTGIVAFNGVGNTLAGDATTNISCGSTVVLIENYSVDTGDRQGVLDPAAT